MMVMMNIFDQFEEGEGTTTWEILPQQDVVKRRPEARDIGMFHNYVPIDYL